MKKLLFLPLLLAACSQAADMGSGLNRLDAEPKDCGYLYTIDTTATTYKLSGAYDYLEKTILEQRMLGDSYYIVDKDIVENTDAVFGPKNTFKFKVKVYNCKK